MSTKTHTLHTARSKNNCPNCFGTDGLEFTFFQDEIETLFYKKPVKQMEEKLYCHTCTTIIYPVNWTEDIERVYEYNKKIAETNKHNLQIKPLFYIVLIVAIILIALSIYFLMNAL